MPGRPPPWIWRTHSAAKQLATDLADGFRREAREREGLDHLPKRFSLTEDEARELVREVRRNGSASFCHEGHTIKLTPSPMEGSKAIWAKRV